MPHIKRNRSIPCVTKTEAIILSLWIFLSTSAYGQFKPILPIETKSLPSLITGFQRGAFLAESRAINQKKNYRVYKKYYEAGFKLKWNLKVEKDFQKYFAQQKDPSLKRGLQFIRAWVQICTQEPQARSEGFQLIKNLLKNEHDKSVKSSLQQSLAYYASGISPRTGKPVDEIKQDAGAKLKSLINSNDQENIRVAGMLWQSIFTRKKNIGFCESLQSEVCFRVPILAVYERNLLKMSKQGQEEKTALDYEKIAKNSPQEYRGQLYNQAYLFWNLAYKHGLKAARFETVLKTYEYECASQKGLFADSFCQRVANNRYDFVMTELEKSKRTLRQVNFAEKFAINYRSGSISEQKNYAVGISLADLYQKASQYENALNLCEELAENFKDVNKLLAAQSCAWQAAAALNNWPSPPPFDSSPVKLSQNYGEKLLSLSLELSESKSSDAKKKLFFLAHAGLLYMNLNKNEEGYALFASALKNEQLNDPQIKARMLGLLVHDYQTQKKWTDLEEICRFGISKNSSPIYKNKNLSLRDFLGDALYFGGKEALDNQKFDIASVKLNDFIKSYRSDSRRPDAMYLLSSAYQGKGEHENALMTLNEIVDQYPTHKIYFAALLKAFSLSSDMALEEFALKFGAKFVAKFATTNEINEVGPSLLQLYKARQFYDLAISTANILATSPKITSEKQIEYGVVALELTLAYADTQLVLKNAKSLLLKEQLPAAIKAKIIQIMAQKANRDANGHALAKLDMELENLNVQDLDVNYARSEIRFMLAELKLDAWDNNLGDDYGMKLKDPTQELVAFSQRYQGIKKSYMDLCQLSESPYCRAGMYRLGRRSEQFLSVLDDIQIPETLSEKEVKTFQKEKSKLSFLLSKTIISSDRRVSEGSNTVDTNPQWGRALTYQNNRNIEVSDETRDSLGFVEWAVVETDNDE